MEYMTNPKSLKKIIEQTKKIDENNFNNIQYLNSISTLLSSNNITSVKDYELKEKIEELNDKIEDINQLTSSLLNELSKRHN